MQEWKFKDPQNTAVVTVKEIVNKSGWIAYVTHDADDGAWQFLQNNSSPEVEDALLISLKEIIELDQTVEELKDLPLGRQAWRDSKESPWQQSKID